ncbi:hypothetical protein HANVADRAFT_54036 [Hanseniaspora valbyensis NRRL Y-1626]|uniref:Uncharacterized protein n=1 Tax=Hanseniaspora valbyensis NRRL Y-1626 TaxID=766949 RepID=A0A1B7T947_9ASCO|nr:hypothetical protein HANVADRAFT_54036 [Hanseniaspora valbyensis NRRL Y-1626]
MAFLVLSPVVAKAYVPVQDEEVLQEQQQVPAFRERADSVSSINSVESLRDSGFKPLRLQQ